MSDPADSAGEPGEATGAGVADVTPADSTPDLGATGQEQGDQSSKRINGLMSLAQRRTAERDAALVEIEQLKAQVKAQSVVEQEVGPSQVELMYPERFAQPEPEPQVDPMLPPEPPVIRAGNSPARGQSVPFGAAPPVIGDMSSPSVRYQRDQAEIAAQMRQLNALGQRWAAESGLMDD
jgi:hypothetical protein